ncbi:heat shock 70 kDa protein 12A-like [Argopecten irradians]|uniref:heat shock 70 kDa protein 12A-like n=1 Tax=Argopecten irradians TaxID=31199 RepID=UPI00371E2E1A
MESELAILYCKHLAAEKMEWLEPGLTCFSNGSKILVLNAKGETVDITAHEVQPDGSIKALDKASGVSWGSTKVDESFRQMLVKIVGNDIMEKFCREYTFEFNYMCREFDSKKRLVDYTTKKKVTMPFPIAFKELFKGETGEDLNETLEKTSYCGKIEWTGDKLRIQPETFRQLFAKALDGTIEHVQNMVAKISCERTTTIIMVGGFSESPLLQAKVKEHFPKMRVVIPPCADQVVLQGAVIYGHTLKVRRAKFTYGVCIMLCLIQLFIPRAESFLMNMTRSTTVEMFSVNTSQREIS